MNLQEIRRIAIAALMVQASLELGKKRRKVKKGINKMKTDKTSATGNSDLADKADTCSSDNVLSKTLSATCEEIKKIEAAINEYKNYLTQSSETIILWSLVEVDYENPDTDDIVKKFYLISPIMPGLTIFETTDVKVYAVSPDSYLGKQMINEGPGSQINCNMLGAPHIGTIIGFA